MLSLELCKALWYQALKVEIGLGITPDDGDLKSLRTELYRAKEKLKDIRLQELTLIVPPNGKEIWLCRKDINAKIG